MSGKNIGLLTDAGCPNIADPGAKLILYAHENNINVIPLIGPSSILLAMMGSGLNGNNFSFNGYLPVDKNERSSRIKKLETQSRNNNQSQIFIETPYRNQLLFGELKRNLNNNTFLCVAKNIGSKNQKIKTMQIKDWKSKKEILEKSSFQIILESITFLSGDFTEKIKPNTKRIVIKIKVITNLSDILLIRLTYLEKFLSGVVFS